MILEIKKEVSTNIDMKDIVTYEMIMFDDELQGNLDDLRKIKDYLVAYVEREEALLALPKD